jgi:hypothetical protein
MLRDQFTEPEPLVEFTHQDRAIVIGTRPTFFHRGSEMYPNSLWRKSRFQENHLSG